MSTPAWNAEDHARAQRIAARESLLSDLMRAVGVAPEPAAITEPIAVVARTDLPTSWLRGG
ncbi:hypothetical protein [Tsukamurella sp. NPDC003166]|uniref:hypothetical protein n=1 Tax=Tsukamurella sp. NPDC003166 TaxID=3154444 RepID=UPI0033AE6791